MDSLQNPNRYMRPMSEPQNPQRLPPPPPPQGPWYSGQFQFQPSPPFPPNPPPQWAPHSDHLHHLHHQQIPPPYHAPHNPPYPAPPHHYAPSPHMAPHPPLPPQMAPSYPPPNQTWGNPNWAHHQGWEYPDRNIPHSNEEDWAARARAWAASKVATDGQHTPSQFATIGRMEEHNHVYNDQYQHIADHHFPDMSSLTSSGNQQLPVSVTNPYRPPLDHLQGSSSFSSGPSSYVADAGMSYSDRDEIFSSSTNRISPPPPQGGVLSSPSVYQQEVPSSYSSIPGIEKAGNHNEQSHLALPLPMSSVHEGQFHSQSMLPASGRSISVEQPHYMYGDQSADAINGGHDQPLDFEQRSAHDNDPIRQTSYAHPGPAGPTGGMEHFAAVSSVHAWTQPVPPGAGFPPIPPAPPGPQFDPPFLSPSSLPGHPAPIFGRIPGPSFRPSTTSVSAPFVLGAGTALHPGAPFHGDANGVLNVSERPKKASVPTWLREELIKKKAVIASSSVRDQSAEDSFHSIGAEGADKPFKKSDQADSKSIDSTRSTEEEEDDEDDVEAARNAAINQEIKRILTEVLLKVTGELFDEIATKVLSEDDLTVEVGDAIVPVNHTVSVSSPAVVTPKASAKVLIPVKGKDTEVDDVSGKSSSSSPGDVLGLGNYASDEDDEEIQSSTTPLIRQVVGTTGLPLRDDGLSEDVLNVVEKGISQAEMKEPNGSRRFMETDDNRASPNEVLQNDGVLSNGASDLTSKGSSYVENEQNNENGGASGSLQVFSRNREDHTTVDDHQMVGLPKGSINAFGSKNAAEGKVRNTEYTHSNTNIGKLPLDDAQYRETRSKSDKNDGHEGKRSSVSKDLKETDSGGVKADQKHSGSSGARKREDRRTKKEKADERNGSKEKVPVQGVKPGEKLKDSDSRKNTNHVNSKSEKKETEKVKRASSKEDSDRKRERTREDKEDRSRHRATRDSHRHKRRRSPSVSGRGRNSGENSLASHTSGSSDDASNNSRKLQTNKRSLSPSPIRSKRRQVSRSPHSKHSQRKHSPYSSLDTRGKRSSRSNTPVRRRR